MKLLTFILAFLCSFLSAELGAKDIKREVIAFWDKSETERGLYTETSIHKNLEVIFNYYGFKLVYVDVNSESDAFFKSLKVKNYAGAVSWFDDNSMRQALRYMSFLKKSAKNKFPILMLGEPGFHLVEGKTRTTSELNQVWEGLGIKYRDEYFNNPLLMEDKIIKETGAQFERKLEGELSSFLGFDIEDEKLESWVDIKIKNKVVSPFIVGENFALIQSGYEVFVNPINYQVQFRFDPFSIIKKLFIKEVHPIPDVSVVCGKRAAFTHIDGDGFLNISFTDNKRMSGEVIIDEIIKKYKVPASISVVVAEVDSDYLGSKLTEELVRDMYKLDYVEAASHTITHPLSWMIEPSDADKETYLPIEKIKNHKGPILAYKGIKDELNFDFEIKNSVDIINKKFLDNTKKAEIVFWSGSCMPPVGAFEVADKANILNINGGDGRYDASYPSYAGLSSLYRKVDKYIQPYSGFANENIYTNLWEGPFSGFSKIIKSFENTNFPYLIKPIDVYYHFYSGERHSSLDALHQIYKYLGKQDLNYIYASDYSKNVLGWYGSKIKEVRNNKFLISDYAHLKTFRIDLSADKMMYPDYAKSKNIIGHHFINNSLYLTLGKDQEAILVLSEKKVPRPDGFSCQYNRRAIDI